MRLLFVSDFHGRIPDLSEWSADLVIAGGDYCEVDEIRDLKFAALARGWPATDWTKLAGPERAEELVERAVAEGSAVLAALAGCGMPVLAIPGNSDRVALLRQAGAPPLRPRPDHPEVEGRITDIETRIVVRDGIAFAGLGGWSGPSGSQRLDNDLAALREQWQRLLVERSHLGLAMPPMVLVSHNVPYGSSLDGVNNPAVPAFVQGKLVGSHRATAVIEAFKPVLCLSGHLHENYGRTERLGATLCVCGAGAYRGVAVRLTVDAAGAVSEPEFLSAPHGATRVLA